MYRSGYSTAIYNLLSIVVIFSITSISSEYEQIEEYNLTEDISKADSLKRKADVFLKHYGNNKKV